MKYKAISGFSIFVLCLLHFQTYSSESLSSAQTKTISKSEGFLFTHFGCSPVLKDLPRDVQFLIVRQLRELLVGKIEFGKAYRETRPLPKPWEKQPTLQESALKLGASLVNLCVPGTFEELPPHLERDIRDLIFTSDDTHLVGATPVIHFVVNLNPENHDRHAPAPFVEFVDLKDKPKPFYETEWMHDMKKLSGNAERGDLCCKYEPAKHDSQIESIKITRGLPLLLYQEIARLQRKPFWQKRGDLLRLLEEYPIHRIRQTSDTAFSIGVGPLEVPFVTVGDHLITQYRHLEEIQEYPEKIEPLKFPHAAIARDYTLLFCRFLEVPLQDHPHYELITTGGINKVGKEYRSALAKNNRFLLLTIKEHKGPEPEDLETRDVKDRLRYKIVNQFHVWDLASGECLRRFSVKGCIEYATICPHGRFALIHCYHYEGDIEWKDRESFSIVLLYHIPSALIVGYQRRDTYKGAFSESGKLFATADGATGNSRINPSIKNTLRIWKLDPYIDLEKLYKGEVLIEHALFILLLREIKNKGAHLSSALSALARDAQVNEGELRNYFKELYRSLPESLQTYLIKLMGS